MYAIKIYFDDLSSEKQAEMLAAYEISCPSDMNWDVFPIVVIPAP